MILRRRLLTSAALLAAACLADQPAEPPTSLATAALDDAVELIGAGDIASCNVSYQDEATAALVQQSPGALVFTAGDNAYPDGTAENFSCFDASWGVFKDRIRPTLGNHEYRVRVTGQPADANPYFDYFNGAGVDSGVAGKRGKGYYAYDHGAWRIYALNSEINAAATSPQLTWLKADLAANPRTCILAMWHRPLFTSGTVHPPQATMKPMWNALEAAGADVVITGHNHQYERFAPQTSAGVASPTGIREFVVGTGGNSNFYGFVTPPKPNSEAQGTDWGVIKFTLYPDRYEWQFLPVEGHTFTDAGSTACSPIPPPPPPPTITLTVSGRTASGKNYMTLDWSGANGSSMDVFRNGAFVLATPNDGHYVNSLTARSPVTYTYKVCETGTAVCSNEGTVEFGETPPPPPPPPPPPITLTAKGRSDGTKQYMTLDWTGAGGTTVDVYRNGTRIITTANDGHYVNSRSFQGTATYVYKVCEAGRQVCSNEQTVRFP